LLSVLSTYEVTIRVSEDRCDYSNNFIHPREKVQTLSEWSVAPFLTLVFFFVHKREISYNRGEFLTTTAGFALLHFIRSCLHICQCRGYTKVSSSLYGNCEIKARCDGSQTVASGGKCRRGSVQPGTSRGYREIALWLAGRHVAPVNNSLANLYRCFSATMIYLRQEMYPSIYVHFDITFTIGRDSWHLIKRNN